MALASHVTSPVACLGIDDWAFRRWRQYGTILVNLATRTIIDLLPDLRAETSVAWLLTHPEIELVSGDYAAAAASGAPQARQWADRFHLLKNLGEVLAGGR